MKTKILINLIILSSFIALSFLADSPSFIFKLEINEGKRMLKQCSRKTPKNVKEFFVPSDSLMDLLYKSFDSIPTIKSSYNTYIKNTYNYSYQVIGLTIKNEKYIYLNAFYVGDESPDQGKYKEIWRKKAIVICDGGNYYWGILFHIGTQKFQDLEINGPGPIILE